MKEMKGFETLEFHVGGYPGPFHSVSMDYTTDQIEVHYNCEGVQFFIIKEPIEAERDSLGAINIQHVGINS